MKVNFMAKKAFFLLFSLVLLCSIVSLGFTVGAACEHPGLFEDGWTVERDTTCVKSGLETQWCYDCRTYVQRSIPLDENAHVPGLWTVVTPRIDCQRDGLEAIYCTQCNKELKKRVIPMHEYSVLFKQEPTCQTDGYMASACLLGCYDIKTETLLKNDNAHRFTEWQVITEPTCVNDSGERVKYCLNRDENGNQCDKTITEKYSNSDNHTNINWNEAGKKAPTCSEPGYILGECEGCKQIVQKELPQHSETEFDVVDIKAPTCTTTGIETRKCRCGLVYDFELPVVEENHIYSDWVVRKEPSCTPGERYKYCKYHYNDKDVEITQAIPANGNHNFSEWETEIEPDCTRTGLMTRTCLDCKDVVETKVLSTKHDFAQWETVAKMSCDESQLQVGTKLAKCNKCTFEKYFTIPSVHTFGDWMVTKVAKCGAADNSGTKKRTCSGCGKVERETYYAEHNFTDWYVTGKPVCATETSTGRTGTYTRWCTTCKYHEEKSIPAVHDFTDWEIITYPSLNNDGTVKPGMKKGYCKYCDKTTEEKYNCEHKWSSVKDENDPCITVSTCIACGFVKEETIHSLSNWSSDVGFTCSNNEAELTRECKNCDYSETKNISLNHPNMREVTVEATCTTSGYTRKICPDCDYTEFVGEVKPALGHKLDKSWTSKLQATCSTPGSRYKACERCDYLEFQLVAKTNHILIELEPGYAPTCTEDGLSAKSLCGVCHQVFEHSVLPATGHTYEEGSETCKDCGSYKNSDNCACSCHSTSGLESIIFKIINKLNSLFGINQQCKCGVLHYEEVGFFAKLFGKG